jgi:hypothetical protein
VLKVRKFAHMDDIEDLKRQIGKLEDDCKVAERRIAEIKRERDEANNLVERMRQHVEDANSLIGQWCEAFDMRLNDDGEWSYADWVDGCAAFRQKYVDLLRDWNRFVPRYNRAIAPKSIGRPLDASNAQVKQVLTLRKARKLSLRGIADETNLSLATVRTIVGRQDHRDRTSRRRLESIDPDRVAEISERSRKRTRDALPKRIGQTLQQGAEMLQEAKGIMKRVEAT